MTYLIIFDPSIFDTLQTDDVHKVMTKLPGSSDWWHYISNAYIVTTSQASGVLSDYIYKILPQLRFLIVKVTLDDSNGVLQKNAWDWINKHKTLATPLRSVLKLKSAPSALSDYLPPIIPSLPFLGPSNTKLPPIRTLNDILFKLKK